MQSAAGIGLLGRLYCIDSGPQGGKAIKLKCVRKEPKEPFMRILGVDEAGRGCVIGPLVVAGVLIEESIDHRLKELGVKDSKLLSCRQRLKMAEQIRRIAIGTQVVRLQPTQIDEVVAKQRKLHKLNRLEARAMARIIEAFRPEIAIVDASDVLADRFRDHILECLSFPVTLLSEHKADRTHPVVSAASVIAKVERDSDIELLRAKYPDLGSGYTSDPKTVAFLAALAESRDEYPDFVRRSWKPAKLAWANARTKQTKLP
jgi:ribonuclease HII